MTKLPNNQILKYHFLKGKVISATGVHNHSLHMAKPLPTNDFVSNMGSMPSLSSLSQHIQQQSTSQGIMQQNPYHFFPELSPQTTEPQVNITQVSSLQSLNQHYSSPANDTKHSFSQNTLGSGQVHFKMENI